MPECNYMFLVYSQTQYNVFLYGTLKKGEPNHYVLSKYTLGRCKFVCDGETVDKFPMVIATKYNIPFLLYKKGCGEYIQGEVYSVNAYLFEKLDVFFEHRSFYTRLKCHIVDISDTKFNVLECWTYFIHNYKETLLDLPNISIYNRFRNYPKFVRTKSINYKNDIIDIKS